MRIVFVHLGTSDSDYMWANIRYLSSSFPKLKIDVLTSNEGTQYVSDIQVNHFQYVANETTEKILNSLKIDSEYRGGFWRYSLERLIALVEHHKTFPNESILHIESDVLLLNTFPFAAFESLQKIAWSPFEKNRDVASLLYLPNLSETFWLHDQIEKLLIDNAATDDMHLLSLISRNHKKRILSLPVSPNPNSVINSLVCNATDEDRLRNSNKSSDFAGIFDAAAIGIWLTGTHPVNSFGVSKRYDTKLIHETKSFIDPSRVNLQYSKNEGLFWIEENSRVNVHTLHIHSKNQKFFSDKNPKLIEECVSKSQKGRILRNFYPRVLMSLLTDNWRRGTLLRFMSWLPGIRNLRKIRNRIRN